VTGPFHNLMHIILFDILINRLERDGNPLSCPVDRNNLIRDKVSDLCYFSGIWDDETTTTGFALTLTLNVGGSVAE